MRIDDLQNDTADISHNSESDSSSNSPLKQQLLNVEALTKELKRLIVKSESALEKEGLREQVEKLERWMESYRRGLDAANKMSENGTNLLNEIRDKIKLSAEELQRLEDEGGNPASREQAAQLEELVKAGRLLDRVIPDMKTMFCEEPVAESEVEHA